MSEQAGGKDNTNRNEMIFIAVSLVLIGSFLYRAFIPAHEYAMRSEQLLTMAFDLGMIVGLFGLRSKLTTLHALFWIALLAGIGLFAIRLTSDAAWWTGHLMYRM